MKTIQGRQISETALLGLAGGLACVQVFLCTQIRNLETAFVELPRTQTEKTNPTLFKTLSFGHFPAAVDALLLKFLSDPAYIHVMKDEHPPAYFDLDLATDLDPLFYDLYTTGANFIAVVRDDGPGARDLLLKGVHVRDYGLPSEEFRQKYWSRGWYISSLLGYVYLFELHDIPKASLAFSDGARLPGAHPLLRTLSALLSTEDGQYTAGIRILKVMIEGEKNPESKEKLVAKRDSLFIGQYLCRLNISFQSYLSHRTASRGLLRTGSLSRKFWSGFLEAEHLALQDPWGGVLSLSSEGKIESSTPHQKVMGLN